MEQLLKILKNIRPDIDFENATSLIDHNVIDSLDIIEIIVEINEKFNIEINAGSITPDNFNDIHKMWSLIENLQNQM